MEPLDQSSQDITSLLGLGVDYEKELEDMNAAVLSLTEEVKEEEEDAQSEPEQGTAAAGEESKLAGAQGGEEKDGGGGAGAPGLLCKENREGSSGSDGDDEGSDQSEKEPRQQDSPPPGAVGGLEPGNAQEPGVHAFTPLQLQELERIFQRKKFPSEFLREHVLLQGGVWLSPSPSPALSPPEPKPTWGLVLLLSPPRRPLAPGSTHAPRQSPSPSSTLPHITPQTSHYLLESHHPTNGEKQPFVKSEFGRRWSGKLGAKPEPSGRGGVRANSTAEGA
ncbi:hypothetical protein H8959_007900 [Pygathrix nigripes]